MSATRMMAFGATIVAGFALAPLSAQSAPIAAAPDSHPAYSSYGMFLGSWTGNDNDFDALEMLIKNQWPTTTPFSELGTVVPGCPLCNQLNDAGKTEALGIDLRLETTADQYKIEDDEPDLDEPIGGTWKYLPAVDPEVQPGDRPVDFYLSVKAGRIFSVFYFGIIEPDAITERRWSTDLDILNQALVDGELILVDPSLSLAQCANNNNLAQLPTHTFLGFCLGGSAVSHIQGLWPDNETTVTPEPAMIGLFGLGLVGLGLARRRFRRA